MFTWHQYPGVQLSFFPECENSTSFFHVYTYLIHRGKTTNQLYAHKDKNKLFRWRWLVVARPLFLSYYTTQHNIL